MGILVPVFHSIFTYLLNPGIIESNFRIANLQLCQKEHSWLKFSICLVLFVFSLRICSSNTVFKIARVNFLFSSVWLHCSFIKFSLFCFVLNSILIFPLILIDLFLPCCRGTPDVTLVLNVRTVQKRSQVSHSFCLRSTRSFSFPPHYYPLPQRNQPNWFLVYLYCISFAQMNRYFLISLLTQTATLYKLLHFAYLPFI